MKLSKLLIEIIDIYDPKDLKSKGVDYSIELDSSKKFYVNLKYKNEHYSLRILPMFNIKRSSINFGSTDENYDNINMNTLINSRYSSRILAAIFGLLRYWIDRYNIQEFEYVAEGPIRNQLYRYYLDKHFSDFKHSQEKYGDKIIQVWKKI